MATTHVRIELLRVHCGNTEDTTGADEFYVVGALTDGTTSKGALTSPMSINDNQEKEFNPSQRVLFDADVTSDAVVRGGLKAFDEDYAKDWAKYGSTVTAISNQVSQGLKSTKDPYAVVAGEILSWATKAFGILAPLDKDDHLGTIELNVPAQGASYEEIIWKFSKGGSVLNPGISTWNYSVVIGVTRQTLSPSGAGQQWSDWEYLGGEFASAPTVASWADNRLDVFVQGTNNHLMHKWWDGHQWSGWEDLGGELTEAPAAVSWGLNRLDCFIRGKDNQLWHKWWDGQQWSDWEYLGGEFASAPTVASWADNRLDVFVQGTNNHLMHIWWNGSQWSGWEDLGGELTEAPAAVSWGPNRIDCFIRGKDKQLWHKWTWLG